MCYAYLHTVFILYIVSFVFITILINLNVIKASLPADLGQIVAVLPIVRIPLSIEASFDVYQHFIFLTT